METTKASEPIIERTRYKLEIGEEVKIKKLDTIGIILDKFKDETYLIQTGNQRNIYSLYEIEYTNSNTKELTLYRKAITKAKRYIESLKEDLEDERDYFYYAGAKAVLEIIENGKIREGDINSQ